MEDIKKTNQQMNILFDKNKCLQTIHTLQSFYKKEFVINQKQESILWQNAINMCTQKKCPIGYYNLFNECISG